MNEQELGLIFSLVLLDFIKVAEVHGAYRMGFMEDEHMYSKSGYPARI
jgi:hypothetical protein